MKEALDKFGGGTCYAEIWMKHQNRLLCGGAFLGQAVTLLVRAWVQKPMCYDGSYEVLSKN